LWNDFCRKGNIGRRAVLVNELLLRRWSGHVRMLVTHLN
jgi:hypothetical protein